MTKKFNAKEYRGKDKIFVAVPFAPRITRIWVWNKKRQEYCSPEKLKMYISRRWETRADGRRKRTYRCFDSLDDARRWQVQTDARQGALDEPSERAPRNEGPFFKEVIAEWKRRRFPAMEEGTQVRYQSIIDLYFGSLLGLRIRDLTPQRLDLWLDELKDPTKWTMQSKKRRMFDHELSLLSTILKYYIDYHDDPTFQFPIKKRHQKAVWLKRGGPPHDKWLPEDHFRRFREKMATLEYGDVLAVLATVQYYQALRISEVAALSWEDVHFVWERPEGSRITVRKKIYWPRLKGAPSVVRWRQISRVRAVALVNHGPHGRFNLIDPLERHEVLQSL